MKSQQCKIAILYIALGNYTVFWKDFYTSSENFFLSKHQKDYFVFTDNTTIDFQENKNIKNIYQKNLSWPYNTMLRFDMFITQADSLKAYDYIFFFNANMQFISPVNEEILPGVENDGLVVGLHPGFYNKRKFFWSYERNPKSSSFIPYDKGTHYVQGCLNGGVSTEYLNLCYKCSEYLHQDMDNDIIPLWHDESVLNKYILDKNPLIMPCNYLYPEKSNMEDKFKNNIKIIQRDKRDQKYGGFDFLRGTN